MSAGSDTGVAVDLAHGGRWTSLRLAGREWLWSRDEPARGAVCPGAHFVDAGGVEECVPTVRGVPDHGDAWSRPWRALHGTSAVECGQFALRRRIHADADAVVASYRLTAAPGFRFVWAAHALLDVSPAATLCLPAGMPVRLYPGAAVYLDGAWPAGAPFVTGTWPEPHGLPLHRLGPDDGSAIGAVAAGCAAAAVVDGADRLNLRLQADPGVPRSVGVWRNLRGFPVDRPYRSIGVEPMLGAVFDLAEAGPDDAVTVPVSGTVRWTLRLSATRAA